MVLFPLFIFQSIGTQELILIGIVALIFLGPRKLPEYARKIGKMMAELRGTANEFRNTWEREVDFEEETRALSLETIETESEREKADEAPASMAENQITPPEIRMIEAGSAEELPGAIEERDFEPEENIGGELSDKRRWL